MKKTDLSVVYRKTADLIPFINNARTHSEEQVTQIASSIQHFGFNNPILIDSDNGVVAGHGRLLAAKKLGLDEVPTIELKGLTEAEKRAYILADNKIALSSGWDYDLLSVELEDLKGDIDLTLTGFDEAEIESIVDGWDSDIDVDGATEPEETHEAKLIFKVDKSEEEHAIEVIENALQSEGIEYER